MILKYAWGLMALIMATALSAEILDNAMLRYDYVKINQGQPFPLLQKLNCKQEWIQRSPFSDRAELDVWFPYQGGVELTRIAAGNQYETPGKVHLSSWDGQCWREIATAPKLDFKFPVPLKTYGIKIVCTDIPNADHGSLQYVGWLAEGKPCGAALATEGIINISTTAKDNVFDLPSRAEATVEVVNRNNAPTAFTIVSRWDYYGGGVAENCPPVAVTLNPGEKYAFKLLLKTAEQGPYVAHVEVSDRNILRAATGLLVGLRDPELATGKKSAERFVSPCMERGEKVLCWKDRTKTDGTIWACDMTHCLGGTMMVDDNYFRKVKNNGTEMLMTIQGYQDFEPLPGVYNLYWIDQIVRNAGKYGLGLELGVWWWDFGGPSQFWLKDEPVKRRDGSAGTGWESTYSLFSKKFTAHAERAMEVMVQRYQDCPEVWMWLPHPQGVVDHDAHGLFDFHPDTIAAWNQYLHEKYGDIGKLNQAYGTAYQTWNAVPVPEQLHRVADKNGRGEDAVTLLDVRPEWFDWLDFYQTRIVKFRNMMAGIVRKYDRQRGISGMNATGGVGQADKQLAGIAEADGFYGDQGLNLTHYFRRFVAARRYHLPTRYEDIAPVKIGRGVTAETMPERCNWNVFQMCLLGLDHFNFVFLSWSQNDFWDKVFANSRIKRLVKDSNRMALETVPAGYLHSWLSDNYIGRYNYSGISIYRWWVQNGINCAMLANGSFWEAFSDGCDLRELDRMKVVLDDGSQILPLPTMQKLTEYVKNGGKLVLTASTGEFCPELPQEKYWLLKQLGYSAITGLSQRNHGAGEIVFTSENPIFRQTGKYQVNDYAALDVPPGGTVLGIVDGKPGAVVWSYGKGQVMLLAGKPGANEEISLDKIVGKSPEAAKQRNDVWSSAEEKIARTMRPLLRDLENWATIRPTYRLNAAEVYSALRHSGDGKITTVYLFNNQKQPCRPVLKIDGLQETRMVRVNVLEGETVLGLKTGNELAAGISLPELPPKSFMAIILEKP